MRGTKLPAQPRSVTLYAFRTEHFVNSGLYSRIRPNCPMGENQPSVRLFHSTTSSGCRIYCAEAFNTIEAKHNAFKVANGFRTSFLGRKSVSDPNALSDWPASMYISWVVGLVR